MTDNLFLDRFEPVVIRQRRGPHWRQDGKMYFVTWRQDDSLPKEVRDRIMRSRAVWLRRNGDVPFMQLPEETRSAYWRLFNRTVQKHLDAGYGSCVLRDKNACLIIRNALHHFNGSRYVLGSFAIAANHVHALVAPEPDIDLSDVQHSWKSFTAHEVNKLLELKGRLWRPESYDRIVRNESELSRITNYILRHKDAGHYVEHWPLK